MRLPTSLRRLGPVLLAGLFFLAAPQPALAQDGEADSTAAESPVRAVPSRIVLGAQGQAVQDTVRAGRFDDGKMWTFDDPPADYFEEAYGFRPDDEWFERARLGALRIPGCTASFVSPAGLVLTNHHCGRSWASSVSQEGEAILDDGFYAATLAGERPVPGLYADQLVDIADVTDEVYAALGGAQTDAERASAREEAIAAITERIAEEAGGEEAGIEVEVISLYNGGKYSAYTFRRYSDLRLVLIPELQVGYYGGDPDNFTYPRYTLDMALFRVYDEDGPLQTEHYFPANVEGSQEGEAVFVVGNPGSTSRLFTVSQFELDRDVNVPAIVNLLKTRIDAFETYIEANPEEAEALDLRNTLFGYLNADKAFSGQLEALEDPYILARRQARERDFRAALEADSALSEAYGDLFERMEALTEERRTLAAPFATFLSFSPGSGLTSTPMKRALIAYPALQAGELTSARDDLFDVEDRPAALDERLLAARLEDLVEAYGEDSDLAQAVLQGRTPAEAAAYVVSNSALADSASLAQAWEAGTLDASDPALEVMAALFPVLQDFRSASAGLGAQEQEVASALGRARYEVYGTAVPPDATFSLRIADGVVKGYNYNGTVAPAYTNYFGLFDHYYSYGDGTPWGLPERWLSPPPTFDYSTPLNLVSTNDIIGGNSGSPLLNRNLELVGLIFDGNIESLVADYIFLPGRVRTVSVDVRGILEALDEIYDADRLVLELTTGEALPTEDAADEAMQTMSNVRR